MTAGVGPPSATVRARRATSDRSSRYGLSTLIGAGRNPTGSASYPCGRATARRRASGDRSTRSAARRRVIEGEFFADFSGIPNASGLLARRSGVSHERSESVFIEFDSRLMRARRRADARLSRNDAARRVRACRRRVVGFVPRRVAGYRCCFRTPKPTALRCSHGRLDYASSSRFLLTACGERVGFCSERR